MGHDDDGRIHALLHVAEVINEARHADAWGVKFAAPTIDLEKVRGFKDKVVAQLTGLGTISVKSVTDVSELG